MVHQMLRSILKSSSTSQGSQRWGNNNPSRGLIKRRFNSWQQDKMLRNFKLSGKSGYPRCRLQLKFFENLYLYCKARQDEEALEVMNDTWAQTHLPSMRMWKLQITCKQINHESLCSSAKHSIGKHVLTHEVEQKQWSNIHNTSTPTNTPPTLYNWIPKEKFHIYFNHCCWLHQFKRHREPDRWVAELIISGTTVHAGHSA